MDKRRDILLKLAATAKNAAKLLEQLAAAEEETVEVTLDAETLKRAAGTATERSAWGFQR